MEKNWKKLKIKFDSKAVYGDYEKYEKKKKHTLIVLLQIFTITKFQKKKQRASVYK